jgi:DNA-binding NarL/FixJ family response regulator
MTKNSIPTNSSRQNLRVFVIDDHPAILEALCLTIADADDMEVCGTAKSASETLDSFPGAKPDVAVVDISLEDTHGLDLVQNIRNIFPDVQVVVFSMYDEDVYAERSIRAGAMGYLMKNAPTERILSAVRAAAKGEIFLSQQTSSRILHKLFRGKTGPGTQSIDDLKDHEFAVFQMLGQGFSMREIQDRLNLSRKTVETYRRHVKEKLGFETVAELLQFAVQWTYGQARSPDLVEH